MHYCHAWRGGRRGREGRRTRIQAACPWQAERDLPISALRVSSRRPCRRVPADRRPSSCRCCETRFAPSPCDVRSAREGGGGTVTCQRGETQTAEESREKWLRVASICASGRLAGQPKDPHSWPGTWAMTVWRTSVLVPWGTREREDSKGRTIAPNYLG